MKTSSERPLTPGRSFFPKPPVKDRDIRCQGVSGIGPIVLRVGLPYGSPRRSGVVVKNRKGTPATHGGTGAGAIRVHMKLNRLSQVRSSRTG